MKATKTATLAAAAALLASSASSAEDNVLSGRASVYENLDITSLEDVTTPEHIVAVTRGNTAPMEIWRALEHGEKVECLDCIPHVANLLYDAHPKTREISAWWLRRRVFGVFGPGEAYSQVVDTLSTDESELKRVYAVDALGEFLVRAGVRHVASAAINDTSALVREHAVRALRRLNNEGALEGLELPALATAMTDSTPEVRLAALRAATRINVFTRVDVIVERISDDDPLVRREAVEALGTMRYSDAVVGLIALTNPEIEPDAEVRKAAVASLGQIGDTSALDAVRAAEGDPDFLVRSAARIALRQL